MIRAPKFEHIKAKARTRGDIREVRIRYLSRLYVIVHHMHEVLRLHAGNTTSIQHGIRRHVMDLAGHLETFFRDLFRFALEQDASFFDKIVQAHNLKLPTEARLTQYGVSRYDFVAETLTLQSASSVAEAFDPLFFPKTFRNAVETSDILYAIPSKSRVARGFPLSAFPIWWDDFTRLFALSHEFDHDANSTTLVDCSDIARLESLAIILPQYVALMVPSHRSCGPEQARYLVTDGLGKAAAIPVIFLVEDFLSTDWEIVP